MPKNEDTVSHPVKACAAGKQAHVDGPILAAMVWSGMNRRRSVVFETVPVSIHISQIFFMDEQ